MNEVSSSDEEVDEVDEPDEETTTPTARGPRAEQTSGETDAGAGEVEIEEEGRWHGGTTFRSEEAPDPRCVTSVIVLRS